MHFELKLGRYDSRINTNPLPPRSFVTAAIELPLVAAAQRHRELANGGAVRTDRHQCCDRTAVTRDDRHPALLGGGQQYRKPIAGLFAPLRCIVSNLHSPAGINLSQPRGPHSALQVRQ